MSKSTPTHGTPAPASARGALHDSGHEPDWWSRLSRTQIDLLKPLAPQLFEKLDDALFDRSGSSFQQFFEGMRLLRKSREVLIQAWFGRLDEGWNALRPQAPGAFRPRLVSARGQQTDATDYASLSLIDEVTLERKLAVESTIARGASLCRMELSPLLHRLTLLRKGVEVTIEDLPAAPSALVHTFAQSLDEVPDLPVEVALVAFKLFDRVVMGSVGVICKELNRLLMMGGVAPQWNWSPATAPRPQASRASSSAAAAESWEDQSWLETVQTLDSRHPQAARDLSDAAASGFFDAHDSGYGLGSLANEMDPTRLMASVRALLEHRRLARYNAGRMQTAGLQYADNGAAVAPHAASAWNMPPAQTVPRGLELHTLMEVLASLPPPELPTSWVDDAEGQDWNPGLLKDELRRSLDHHGRGETAAQRGTGVGSSGQRRSDADDVALGEHEDVIDMVAMMFGFIQKDQALPSAVQALMSRMQLPYLRLALVDPGLFSDAAHPARALMDRLAEVGKTCTPGSPMLAERMLKMHSLVARVVGNHDVSRSFFEGEWQRFRTWSDAIARRVSAREQKLAVALAEAEAEAKIPAVNEADASEPELVEFLASVKQAANDMVELPVVVAATASPVQPQAQSQPQPAAQSQSPVVTDVADERAQLHQIRLAVTAKMRERLEGKVMPEGLRHALSLLWVGHQVRIWQQHGERSFEASSLERKLDAVVALLDVVAGEKAQADFDCDWPDVERTWNAVLAEGPASAEARACWIATFRHWADVRTGRVAEDPAYQWNWYDGMTADPVAMTFIAPIAQHDETTGAAPARPAAAFAADDAASKPAIVKPAASKATPARWAVGDWIEFKNESGEADATARNGRGKVSWIGSFTGRTVLVKTDGTLWREEERADLDDMLDRGLAFIVPRASLFDRSLRSMFDRLREGAVPAPATPT